MASFPDLRHCARLAKAECRAALSFGSFVVLLTAAAAVVSTLAFVAVSEFATLRGHKADVRAPAFLARALGSPESHAPGTPASDISLIKPALGAKLEIAHGGFDITSGHAAFSLH